MSTVLYPQSTQPAPAAAGERAPAQPDGSLDTLSVGAAVLCVVLALAGALEMPSGVWDGSAAQLGLVALLGATAYLISFSVDRGTARDRRSWVLVGYGVNALALAELTRLFVGEGPSFGLVDILTVAFALVAAGGLLMLPHAHDSTAGRLRLGLDAAAGAVAISALLLDASLRTGGGAVDLVMLLRLIPELVLCAALLVTALRRSPYRLDRRLMTFTAGAALWILADLVTTVSAGGGAVALRLAATGSFAMMAWSIRRPVARRVMPVVRTPLWTLVLPYGFVAVLCATFFLRALGDSVPLSGPIPWATVLVVAIVGPRQMCAARENRRLVELERDHLIASVSHELRTPLTAVTGFADVIWDEWSDLGAQEAREMMGIIRTQSHHLSGIVTSIAALVRDDLDGISLDVDRVDARELVADAIKAVFDLNAGPAPVSAQVEAYTEVIGDRKGLTEALVALLKNAQRYGRGRIVILAGRRDDARLFEVHDDGDGVPPRYAQLVWERFERGEHALNSRVPGSGLGLALVRTMVKAHDGRVGYRRSERLGGACFWFEIPYDPT